MFSGWFGAAADPGDAYVLGRSVCRAVPLWCVPEQSHDRVLLLVVCAYGGRFTRTLRCFSLAMKDKAQHEYGDKSEYPAACVLRSRRCCCVATPRLTSVQTTRNRCRVFHLPRPPPPPLASHPTPVLVRRAEYVACCSLACAGVSWAWAGRRRECNAVRVCLTRARLVPQSAAASSIL